MLFDGPRRLDYDQTGDKLNISRSNSIVGSDNSLFVRAMGATEKFTARLDPVANDLAAAMRAVRRQRMNGAFKTIVIV
jgi:hypothetical protein